MKPDALELIETPYWGLVAHWDDRRKMAWAERAAIMQVDGGLSQEEAERRAYEIVLGL